MSSVSFDRIAPYYDRLAQLVFGRSMPRAQCFFLNRIPPNARVLVVGGGSGWLLPYLLAQPEIVHITYVETSIKMLALAQQKLSQYDEPTITSVDFIHGNEQSLPDKHCFSAVITNFVLDMYQGEALDRLIQTLAAHLEPHGRWLLTDFRLSEKRKHRLWQRVMTKAMYTFFHLTAGIAQQSLPLYDDHLIKAGFQKTQEQSFFADFIVSQVYQRAVGSNMSDY